MLRPRTKTVCLCRNTKRIQLKRSTGGFIPYREQSRSIKKNNKHRSNNISFFPYGQHCFEPATFYHHDNNCSISGFYFRRRSVSGNYYSDGRMCNETTAGGRGRRRTASHGIPRTGRRRTGSIGREPVRPWRGGRGNASGSGGGG